MAVTITNLQRMRVLTEAFGSFGADGSGTMGNYTDVPFIDGSSSLRLNHEMLPTAHAQQRIDGMSDKVVGIKSWQLDFKINLQTLTTKAGDGVAATQGALGLILAAVMGGENLGTGDTVSDATPAAGTFDVATSARWAAGGAIGAATGTGSALECRPIQAMSGSTMTLKQVFSSAPADSSVLYNAASYYMHDGYSATTSLQFAIEGLEQDHRFLCMGGQLTSISLDVGPAVVPTVTLSISGVDWDYADGTDTSGTLTGTALGYSTYTNVQTIVVKDSEFRVFTRGTETLTGTSIAAALISMEPNISYVQQRTPGGVETVARYVRVHAPPVIKGSFTLPYEDQTWKDAKEALTAKAVWYQIGTSTTTGAIVLDAPNVQIVDWQLTDNGGIHSQVVSWEGRNDADVGAVTTDLALSAFRIHLF